MMCPAKELKLSTVIYGAMGYNRAGHDTRIRTIQCAIDEGITSIDTAPLYGAGESEEVLGKAITGRREQVQVLSKCGLRWDSDHGAALFEMEVDGVSKIVRIDCRGRSIEQEIDQCLARLNIDHIDLWQVHQYDSLVPLEETMEALSRIRKAGKIREIGVSNFSLEQSLEAHEILPEGLFSVQNEFNLLHRKHLSTAQSLSSHGIKFIGYSPLAQGLLSGLRNSDSFPLRFGPAYDPQNISLVQTALRETLLPVAEGYGINIAQLSLSWAMSQTGIDAVVAGASNETQCKDNARTMTLVMTQSDLDIIGGAIASCGYNPEPNVSALRKVLSKIKRAKSKFYKVIQ